MERVDCIIIGAGVIGLAIGRKLTQQGREVYLVEQHTQFGEETSSRNSGVIHAGIYYPASFLKTRLCIQGRKQLYQYCQQHHIPHQKIGKLIVANDHAGELKLQQLHQHARVTGVELQPLTQQQIRHMEPELRAQNALFSAETGIVDQHALMLQLSADIEHAGGQLVYQQCVTDMQRSDKGFELTLNQRDRICCNTLINAAGLHANHLSNLLAITPPPRYIAKGNYFSYQGASPFHHLIYPTPETNTAGLGIHATLDLQQRLRFGPDVEYIDTPDFQVNKARKADFINAIQRYWPALDASKLQPDFAGCRPKLQAQGAAAEDFMIQSRQQHGINNLIQCFGIESPGLTASLAIADYVSECLHD